MEKVKVLHVIGNLSIGGAENAAMNYYRYIDRDKFQFDYLVYGDKIGEYEEEVVKLGGRVLRVEEPSKNYFQFYKNIKAIMKEYGEYDIVHSHTLFNSGFILKAAKKTGIKRRIAHAHSTRNKIKSSLLLKIYEKYMRGMILRNASDVVACSNAAGSFLVGHKYFNEKGIVIKNGIETSKYMYKNSIRDRIRKQYNISEDTIVIGNVGHLAAVKNQKFIIDILNFLQKEYQQKYLVMLVGEGEERESLNEYIKVMNLESKVKFTGNVDNVNEILQCMDVFVFPSLFEGLGIALIEAQAVGLKCIISENIPDEAIVTDKVVRLSLSKTEKEWAEEINNNNINNKEEYWKVLCNSGYDVISVARWLEDFYINQKNNLGERNE